MIQIDALFLCSAARPDPASGLLIILGAGGNAFQSPIGFPAPILPTCVLLFSADGTDFGTRHEIEIAIVGSDGPSEGPTTFDWTVEKPADYIAGMRIVRWEHAADSSRSAGLRGFGQSV